MSEDDRARFYREAKAAAQLDHPHFASVFEIDEAAPRAVRKITGAAAEEIDVPVPEGSTGDDLSPFIVMEYIEGETLRSRKKKGPLTRGEAVRLSPS